MTKDKKYPASLIWVMAVIGVWYCLYLIIQQPVVPSPAKVGMRIFQLLVSGSLGRHIIASLLRLMEGMGLAMVVFRLVWRPSFIASP